ncbi:MAG: hypothetical protein WCJ37_02380 [Syntrophus sp. (in: bacteria)]
MAAPVPPTDCDYGIWLTAPSVSGGKSWIGFRTSSNVEVHWGKINQVNQHKTVDLNRSFPRTVLADMARKKFAKGYQVAREWDPKNGWIDTGTSRTGRQQQPLPPPPSPPESPIHHSEPSKKGFNRLTVVQAVNTWLNSPSKGSSEKNLPDEWF